MRRLDLAGWLYGALAAVIGGGAGAVTAGISVSMLDPSGGFRGMAMVKLMGLTFALNGLFSLFFYLKTSPLPPLVEIKRSIVDKSTFTDATGTQVERTQTVVSTESKADARKDERALAQLPVTPAAPVAVVVTNQEPVRVDVVDGPKP